MYQQIENVYFFKSDKQGTLMHIASTTLELLIEDDFPEPASAALELRENTLQSLNRLVLLVDEFS